MTLTLTKQAASTLKTAAIVIALFFGTIACQQQKTENEEIPAPAPTEANASLVSEKRPAPTFFIIPKGMEKKRVWILEDSQSDIFHLKHDCPVLVTGKGKGSFRNLTMHRAIEEYGRYNCQECSKDLNHIFDEDMVRMSE
ncbi:hypothetical protein ACFSRY_13790 [Pontibacter locisalis]|uniref:Uncharacterized protein n=1 Tax=Pontibacter locisalis TaxID=1719035 RepID=A0ABW5INR7_9BACT